MTDIDAATGCADDHPQRYCPWCGGSLTEESREAANQARKRMEEPASRWRAGDLSVRGVGGIGRSSDPSTLRTELSTAFRIKPSPFKNDDALFIEDAAGALLVAVFEEEGRIFLENRATDETVSFSVEAVPIVISAIYRAMGAACAKAT